MNIELSIQYPDFSYENKGIVSLQKSCTFFREFPWKEQTEKQNELLKTEKQNSPCYFFWSNKSKFVQLLYSEEGFFTIYTGKLFKWWHVFIPKKQYSDSIDQLQNIQVEEIVTRFYKNKNVLEKF